jgi:hypothetical protein
LESQKRETASRIKDVEKRIGDTEKEKNALSFVPEMDRRLKEIERDKQAVIETASESRRIDDLIKGAIGHRQTAEIAQKRITGASSVISVGDKWAEVRVSRDRLVVLLRRAGSLQDVTARPVPNISPAIKLEKKWKGVCSDLNLLNHLTRETKFHKTEVEKWERKEKTLRKQFKQKMGKVCPLCDSQLKT